MAFINSKMVSALYQLVKEILMLTVYHGMSASKMRTAASDNDLAEFSKGVPSTNNTLVKSLYTAVRKGLGIREAMNSAVDQFMAERVKAGKVDPLSAMGKQKLTGAEVADYYKKNPIGYVSSLKGYFAELNSRWIFQVI